MSGRARGRRNAATRIAPVITAAVLLVAASCTSDADTGASGATPSLTLTALSSRPEFVSGGDVLVEAVAATGTTEESGDAPAPTVVMQGDAASGEPVTLEPVGPGRWRGVVSGLPDGPATLEASLGPDTATLDVTNHPITGPMFSGPQQEPFACTTEELGLGAPLDEDCTIAPRTVWHYLDTAGAWKPFTPGESPLADVQTIETAAGTVPAIARTEIRTIDRGVSWITVPDPSAAAGPVAGDPAAVDPTGATAPWDAESSGWNSDLVYRFGGGCGTSYSQGSPLVLSEPDVPPTLDSSLLRRGFAVATNTLNTFQVHCNDVVSAEAASMTKEHFTIDYGVPRHTIGEGGSGGAIQQFLITQNYPGILDASVIGAPFPDAMSMAPGVTDCGLLLDYYRSPSGSALDAAQRTAINGHATDETCGSWAETFLQVVDPTVGCALPDDLIYDPVLRPDGARCTLQDSAVNLFGVDPATGFARRPLDNTGVAYGLEAFRAGVIDAEQFTALNEGVGSYDIDGKIQSGRSRGEVGDLEALARSGRVLQGSGDATRIPVVAVNTYSDPTGDIHDRWRIFSVRERYERTLGGEASGLAVWTTPGGNLLDSALGGAAIERDRALDAVAEWLAALEDAGSDTADDDRLDALARTRPAAAADRCVLPDGTEVTGPGVYDEGTPCATAYPLAGDPRRAAGQPIDGLAARCELQPIDQLDVAGELSDGQLARLRVVFPDGVCDYSRPGVGNAPVDGTWRTYN